MSTLLILSVLAALAVGLVVLFFFFGLSRITGRSEADEKLRQMVDSITQSEVELERLNTNDLPRNTWTGYWYNLAKDSGSTPQLQWLPGGIAGGIAIFGLLFGIFVFPRDVLGSVIAVIIALVIMRGLYKFRAGRRLVKLDAQLPALLSGLRANLQANNTPQQAVLAQAEELDGPLGDELKIVRDEVTVGIPLDQALQNLAARVPSREVKFLVASIRIAVSSGSDLEPLVKTIQEIINARRRVANHLASAVANSQPTILVAGIVIPAAFLYNYFVSPTNREYWGTFQGILVLVVITFLYLAGLFIAKKLVDRVKNA